MKWVFSIIFFIIMFTSFGQYIVHLKQNSLSYAEIKPQESSHIPRGDLLHIKKAFSADENYKRNTKTRANQNHIAYASLKERPPTDDMSTTSAPVVSHSHVEIIQLESSLPSSGPIISFNFDDGFVSSYKYALPIFNALHFKTTQYIVSNFLGTKGYVTKEQVQEMYKEGHEIGGHTRNHIRLTTLSTSEAWNEINGGRQDLLSLGVGDVSTFAYPNGDLNSQVEDLVRQAGFTIARMTKPGFNDNNTDRYALYYLRAWRETTFPEVKSAIDQVETNKKWLIIVIHRTDEAGDESVSHELIQQIVDYVKSKNIPVVTNEEGMKIVQNIQ